MPRHYGTPTTKRDPQERKRIIRMLKAWGNEAIAKLPDYHGAGMDSWSFRLSSRGISSRGTTFGMRAHRTTMGVGSDMNDARYVVLHELCHAIPAGQANHSVEMYERLYQLCRDMGVPVEYAVCREYSYKRTSRGAAINIGLAPHDIITHPTREYLPEVTFAQEERAKWEAQRATRKPATLSPAEAAIKRTLQAAKPAPDASAFRGRQTTLGL